MIRKPVCELTVEDIENIPAWEYALDEEHLNDQDESTIRPYVGPFPIDPASGQVIIRAKFVLADGTKLLGTLYAKPQNERECANVQPVILLPNGRILFWHGSIRPAHQMIAEYFELLGKANAQVFPIKYSSDQNIIDGPISGLIEKFS